MKKKDVILLVLNLFFSACCLFVVKYYHFEKEIYNVHDFGNFVLLFFSVSGAVFVGRWVSLSVYGLTMFIKKKLGK